MDSRWGNDIVNSQYLYLLVLPHAPPHHLLPAQAPHKAEATINQLRRPQTKRETKLILESNFVQPDDRTHVVELVTKSA
jgi:hypothetical protein